MSDKVHTLIKIINQFDLNAEETNLFMRFMQNQNWQFEIIAKRDKQRQEFYNRGKNPS